VLVEVAERYEGKVEGLPRILQFSSEDRMTKYEICKTLGDVTGLPVEHIVPNT